MLPRKILKSSASNDAFWSIFGPKSGSFFVLGTLNGGGTPAPPSGSATASYWSIVLFGITELGSHSPVSLPDVHPMPAQCWASVADDGPALSRR